MAPRKRQTESQDNDPNIGPSDSLVGPELLLFAAKLTLHQSPYASRMINIHFENSDPTDLAMHVHEALLQPFPGLSSLCGRRSRTTELRLEDVSQNAGHVLVHFLYTGKYQILKVDTPDLRDRLAAQFRTCLQVYLASKTYKLHNLQGLIQIELEQLGQKVAIPDLIAVAEEIYSGAHQVDLWFQSFIHSCLSRMSDDLELFENRKILRELEMKNTIGSMILRSCMLRPRGSNMAASGSSAQGDVARNQERPFRADKTEPTTNNPEPPNSNVSSSADDTPLTASFEDLGSV
ncbi:Uncharacterized protein HZ326_30474 [Fusarium oxysporum f. sp. albedinis]|nr:Uncharacterized protein HZ326_30474 [Fusarium oxysporum f. sp. albedinis]